MQDLAEDVFLAFRMNGQPLPPVHGYPLRNIVPGIFGMKNVKWLTKIELVNYDFKGYWEKRGWSDEAVIPLMSEILMPMDGKRIPLGHYVIGCVAFGGRHGVSRIQVAVGERNWQEAELRPPLSKWAWTLWRYDRNPTREGNFSIRVRAFDRCGKIQESPSLMGRVPGSYPDGASGIHAIHVQAGRARSDAIPRPASPLSSLVETPLAGAAEDISILGLAGGSGLLQASSSEPVADEAGKPFFQPLGERPASPLFRNDLV
jgi:hypothetical protein